MNSRKCFGLISVLFISVFLAPVCRQPDYVRAETSHVFLLAILLEMYHDTYDRYPTELPEIEPFQRGIEFVDEWSTPIRYEGDKDTFEVASAGPDRKFGTLDDIVLNNETFPKYLEEQDKRVTVERPGGTDE